MSNWKVIFATLVIFTAGVVTGGLLINYTKKNRPPKELTVARVEMLKRLTHSLELTPEQRTKLDHLLQESAERSKILNEILEPERRAEYRKTLEAIRTELNPQQRTRFDELLRQKRKASGGPEKRRQPAPSNSLPTSTNLIPGAQSF